MPQIERGPLPQDNYTIISNDWLRDKRLSWDARGILAWLASHSAGFTISVDRIVAACEIDGKHIVRGALKELEDLGYLIRQKDRGPGGRIISATYKLLDPNENPQVTSIVQSSNVGSADDGSADDGSADDGSTDSGPIGPLKKTTSTKKTNGEKTPVAPGAQLKVVGGTETAADASPSKRVKKTYMTEDWLPPVEAANKMCAELGVTRDQLGAWLPEFRDYWIGISKPMGDWVAVWRNNVRKRVDLGHTMPGRPAAGSRTNDPALDVLRGELERHNAAGGAR